MRGILFSFFIVGVFFSCQKTTEERNSDKSKLLAFDYMGHGDTSCATLFGEVYQKGENGDTIPLSGVTVVISDHFQDFETDPKGYFSSCNGEGTKEIEVTKEGFQTAIIENYIAKSDQVSGFKLLLEKGDEDVILKIQE